MKIFNGIKKNRGMSYIELIVVLSIFAVMSSIIIFNYQEFQTKVDMKNLASDIALKVVEAQKSSLAGELPPFPQQSSIISTWKPSYGLYFNPVSDNKSFTYFTDLNQNGIFDDVNCSLNSECLEKINITKGNSISSLSVFYQGDATAYNFNDLTITFKRPNSSAVIKSTTPFANIVSYVQINIISPSQVKSNIKIYPSGRIQVN